MSQSDAYWAIQKAREAVDEAMDEVAQLPDVDLMDIANQVDIIADAVYNLRNSGMDTLLNDLEEVHNELAELACSLRD